MSLYRYSAVVILLCAGCSQPSSSNTSAAAPAESNAPAVTVAAPEQESAADATNPVQVKLLNYDQLQELIASHKGKVVVMDCWSTSCEPCVKEFPNLVAIHKKYGPEKVACISLSFDYEGLGKPEDVMPVVQEFLQKQGATFDNVLGTEDSETLYKKMELASVPAVYVYDRDGKLAKRFDNEDASKPEDAFNYEHVGKLVEELVQ